MLPRTDWRNWAPPEFIEKWKWARFFEPIETEHFYHEHRTDFSYKYNSPFYSFMQKACVYENAKEIYQVGKTILQARNTPAQITLAISSGSNEPSLAVPLKEVKDIDKIETSIKNSLECIKDLYEYQLSVDGIDI
jgi:hypothetical protein